MSPVLIAVYTILAIGAFAGNSVLTRAALDASSIDAASFSAVRLLSGAFILWLLLWLRRASGPGARARGSWSGASMLFIYTLAFSYAYISLPTSTGALILFAAVQLTMVGVGIWQGQRLSSTEGAGMLLAFCGLVYLIAPTLEIPSSLAGVMLMLVAGIAWGFYSLNGRGSLAPLRDTAWNFARCLAFATLLLMVSWPALELSSRGLVLAIASGALTSGLGYAIWYHVLPRLSISTAAVSQLSVPVVAAAGGVLFVGELITLRLSIASIFVLGGILLAVAGRQRRQTPRP
jgi:drug/metabolite transporter (DMT)-like permease